jgi:hypothetical protein
MNTVVPILNEIIYMVFPQFTLEVSWTVNVIYLLGNTRGLPVVLYGCETWSLTLREERRRRVFENRVLRRVFGPKRDEVTGEWRKLHNEELSGLYSLPNIVRMVKSRRMRWEGHVVRMGEGRGVHRVLVGKPEGTCEFGNELSGSIKCGEFLDQLQNQLASEEGLCSME